MACKLTYISSIWSCSSLSLSAAAFCNCSRNTVRKLTKNLPNSRISFQKIQRTAKKRKYKVLRMGNKEKKVSKVRKILNPSENIRQRFASKKFLGIFPCEAGFTTRASAGLPRFEPDPRPPDPRPVPPDPRPVPPDPRPVPPDPRPVPPDPRPVPTDPRPVSPDPPGVSCPSTMITSFP
jgi:hypothetical protein